MTQLLIDRATLEQAIAALRIAGELNHQRHCGYKTTGATEAVFVESTTKAIITLRAALANAEQAECGNTPYDEGPFTIANAEPEEDQLIFNKGDMDKYLNAKGIKFVNASHLAIRYAKSKEHP